MIFSYTSLLSGIFPNDWKFARVTPLFKQGEASDLNNYRPISVISVIAKVFQRIVYDQLHNFLSNEDTSTHQSGFRSLHSTVTALLAATDNWAFNIDRGNVNAVAFLHLNKGFDTVDHDILLSKMNLYGIQGIALKWFRSYLTNLHNDVSLMIPFLESVHLNAGYLWEQSLVACYFLFASTICQTAQLHASLGCMLMTHTSLNSIQLSLNHDLGNLNKWLISNKLTLNTAKTEFMLIGSRQKLSTLSSQPELSIDNILIEKVTSVKSLGIFIDENLQW